VRFAVLDLNGLDDTYLSRFKNLYDEDPENGKAYLISGR